ncbi:unnamed protein product [Adineta steineri]|uniref:Uncharacterized protein n=1 Tax=Adineta steineri TaxID=433720 RepID=A0A814MCR1_9BILA|nr:unnamed protein product [Adineta steineri]CAF3517312.1 unnamed protein product [Adineta steineri]
MFSRKTKLKRPASPALTISSSSSLNIRSGLFECYNFLAPNEYSNKTFGLLAFLLRNSVGEINFSSILDEAEKNNEKGQTNDFVRLLKEKRSNLTPNDASIEKCLMLTRLISSIEMNESEFISLLFDVRMDMRLKITDNLRNQPISYPNDFRQREQDFDHRRNAQDIRRLFYLNHEEARKPSSLISLQNKVTEHLSYMIDCKMRYDAKFRDTGIKELEKIIGNSFMITAQPLCGLNPVTIYERRGPGEYGAKISVTIVSLLHDFMETHPNLIELYDIETSLWPLSPLYKLDESQTLSWKTCQLQVTPNDKPQIIDYAELSFITILQSNKTNTRIHFGEVLHSLKFAIKLHLNLSEYKLSKTYQIPLESLSFAITSHNNHIPHMLTKVILDDIKRFSKASSTDVKVIVSFILRYFKHRTGVVPYPFLEKYVEHELTRALNERRNFQSMEDIFMDFLVPFVQQVEFMAKHPVLCMFYADGLFLGICKSEQAAETMMNSTDNNSPIVGLRMNSIKVDYRAVAATPSSSRPIKVHTCAVRVDIYNKNTNKFQYRTFDSSILPIDIKKFVTTAYTENASHIRVLSNLGNNNDDRKYRSFTDFDKYYDDFLHDIYKTNEKYKPLTNLILNVENEDNDDSNSNGNDNQHTELANMLSENPESVPPNLTSPLNDECTSNTISNHNTISYAQTGFNRSPLHSIHSPPQTLDNQELIRYALSHPDLVTELLRQIDIQQRELSMPYQNQQAFPIQSHYQQQQQQQPVNQQFHQQLISPIYHNQQNNENQYQQSLTSSNYNNQWIPQQDLTRAQMVSLPQDILNQTTFQASAISSDQDLLQFDDWLPPN